MTAITEPSLKRIVMAGRQVRRQSGFTLIELMVVVLVLAILAGLAFASYENSTVASRRKAGAACLLEASQFMERWYTTNLSYQGAAIPALACQTDLAGQYVIALTASAPTTYTVTATPAGRQATKDAAKCGTLGLNQSGNKTRTGSAALSECW
jgi:type IV pilus assembly protein PilE